MATVSGIRSSTFSQLVGVNAHLQATQGNAYVNVGNVLSAMQYLGSTQLRDNVFPVNNPAGQTAIETVAKAGIKFDMCVGSSYSDLSAVMQGLDQFAAAVPGALAAVEGPNEINYNPFTYAGQSGQAAAEMFQADLYNHVKADPALSGVKVFDLTGKENGPVASADASNTHLYPYNGFQPAWFLGSAFAGAYGSVPTGPKVMTEAGYNTDPLGTSGVNQDVQAKQTLNLLFDAMKANVSTVYLYELLDEYSDPTNAQQGNHWGLFNADGTPKPAATAIHNTQAILADTSATAATFTPGSLDYTLSGLPSTAQSILMQRSNGTFELVIWAEPSIWNPTTETETSAAASTVTVSLGKAASSVSIYDPLQSSAALSTASGTSQVTLSLSDHPVIVQITPGAAAAAPAVVPAITSTSVGQGASANKVTLSGTAASGSQVAVAAAVEGTTVQLGTATVSSAGTWTLTTGTLADDKYGFTATTTAASGVASTSAVSPVVLTGVAATVTGVQSTVAAGSSLITGQSDYFILSTSNRVAVTGTPSLSFSDGATATYDAGHSTANAVAFHYVAKVGETTPNLSVTGLQLNGGSIKDPAGVDLSTAGLAGLAGSQSHLAVNQNTLPTVQVGKGADVLALDMSEDPWGAAARFTVSIDGVRYGRTLSTAASAPAHQVQEFDIHAALSAGAHTLAISFLNDAYGGSASTDRNLDIDGAALNGATLAGASAHMTTNGTTTFNFVTTGSGVTGLSVLKT